MEHGLKQKRGFTLIELLVVISIIGILSSLSMVSVNLARKKARDVKRQYDISQVQLALYMYYDDNQQFPEIGAETPDEATNNWNDLADALDGDPVGPLYIGRMPYDPQPTSEHQYNYVSSDGVNYTITYWLEDGGERVMTAQ